MAKTNRRTKPATDAHLTNIPSERTPSPPQALPRKSKSKKDGGGSSAQPAASAPTSNATPSQSHALPRPGSKQALNRPGIPGGSNS